MLFNLLFRAEMESPFQGIYLCLGVWREKLSDWSKIVSPWCLGLSTVCLITPLLGTLNRAEVNNIKCPLYQLTSNQ